MSFGLSAGTIALIGAGASVAGGMMGASAAGSAADAQAEAARASDATQRYMYDTTRKDNAAFLANGTAASNSLARRLGLGGGGSGSGVDESDPVWKSIVADYEQKHRAQFGTDPVTNFNAGPDERALYDQMAGIYRQTKGNLGQEAGQDDSGSLLRKFTMADRDADPVYQSGLQFGLDEGRKGIARQAAATGSSLSGATLKALTRFGTDYGSTKAGESYNRFKSDQDSVYNKLAGAAGSGQVASAQVGSAGANAANNISQSQQSAGNARAAGYIGSANAIGGGLAGGFNAYQNNNLMSRIFPGGGSTSGASGFGGGGLMDNLKSYGVF